MSKEPILSQPTLITSIWHGRLPLRDHGVGIGGMYWYLKIQGNTPLIYPSWCQGTLKREMFDLWPIALKKTEEWWSRSWNWPFCRHCKDIYRLKEVYWNIPNDFPRSYMMESNLPVCVLICLDVYIALQKTGQKKQKIVNFAPPHPNLQNPILVPWYSETSPMTL